MYVSYLVKLITLTKLYRFQLLLYLTLCASCESLFSFPWFNVFIAALMHTYLTYDKLHIIWTFLVENVVCVKKNYETVYYGKWQSLNSSNNRSLNFKSDPTMRMYVRTYMREIYKAEEKDKTESCRTNRNRRRVLKRGDGWREDWQTKKERERQQQPVKHTEAGQDEKNKETRGKAKKKNQRQTPTLPLRNSCFFALPLSTFSLCAFLR